MCIKELTGLVTLFTNQGIEIIPYLLLLLGVSHDLKFFILVFAKRKPTVILNN